jgi:glycerophosphoryl diester phosphodiesterase
MVQVVSHRGAGWLLPENTLPGFERAIELGCDLTECDVRLSADGKLVVLHDATVDRTTNGSGQVVDLSFDQLRELDAGNGALVPTLDEVLEVIDGRIKLLCELKAPGTAAPSVAAVREHGLVEQVIFTSFQFERLAEARALGDELRLGGILASPALVAVEHLAELRAASIGVHHEHLTPQFVRAAQERGLHVRGWNPNTEPEIERLLEMGPDGISSDRPDLALKIVRGA